ncbi:MAG: radical SAM family heme chaperone HemW [Clostridia bacterium]|nr:radical SAM family heme chaperone HemW [Clostridia bacterium]
MKASIYVHVPFCKSKCAYCDFESYAGKLDVADEYISRVLSEAKRAKTEYGAFGVPSVFIGGGTPSLLSKEQIGRIVSGLSDLFTFEKDIEITLEANPGTVDDQKLSYIKKTGVNRISFGAQAAQEHILKSLGRIHTWPDVEKAVKLSQDAGIGNINVDLMYALPGQTMGDFLESVKKAYTLGIKHLSLYSLILEEGTRLFESAERGEVLIPGDEESVSMQESAIRLLDGIGMKRYEISNYAYPGYECRHNIVYWTRGNYLGLGCAAHSLMNEVRFLNPPFSSYMTGEEHIEKEAVDAIGRIEESIMLETRMTRGLDVEAFSKSFGGEITEKVLKQADKLILAGYAERNERYLSFTREGMNIHNTLVVKLIEKL